MKTWFANHVLNNPGRVPMPIGVYAGLEITGATVRDAVTSANAQADAVLALHERFETPVMLTAMDLSAEAQTYGCEVRMYDEEIPTVIGRLATDQAGIDRLPAPCPGDMRTAVHLEAARILVNSRKTPVLGGLIGPFSLAGRIFGVSEALEATAAEPEMILTLLEKVTDFLLEYTQAFREIGAAGVIMAEPAAGLLSPRGLGKFSAPFVRRIVESVQNENFSLILHNCGARLVHLPKGIGIWGRDISFWRSNGYRCRACPGGRSNYPVRQPGSNRCIFQRDGGRSCSANNRFNDCYACL
jgi:uroporphyrinogen decarboxylase